MTECPGPCNHRWRKAEEKAAKTGEPHELRPVWGEPVWCVNRHPEDPKSPPRCTEKIRAALYSLVDLMVHLDDDKATRTADPQARVSGTADAPSPSPQYDEQDETARWLWDWEQTVRSMRNLTVQDTYPAAGVPVSTTVRFLGGHFEWLIENPDLTVSVPFGEEILTARRHLERFTKSGSVYVPMAARCPSCHRSMLFQELGTDDVECRAKYCGRVLKVSEYDDMVAALFRSTPETA